MDVSLISRMKELEDENRRLKKMYFEEKAQSRDRVGGSRKKVVRPSRRREMARKAVKDRDTCIRVACEAFRASASPLLSLRAQARC
jgi:putative transposase